MQLQIDAVCLGLVPLLHADYRMCPFLRFVLFTRMTFGERELD